MKYDMGMGYQEQTGWIGANDGFLVLDRDFNNSVDNGIELLSNPLVADPAKELRSLTGAHRYAEVRFDDSGQVFGLNPNTVTDELHAMLGVERATAYAAAHSNDVNPGVDSSRYEYSSTSDPGRVGYGSISSQTLEAKDEGNHMGNLALTDNAERCYLFNRSLRMFDGGCRVNTYAKTCANESDWRQVA